MKTIKLELSDKIYDRVINFLELLPKNECYILENQPISRQTFQEALDAAVNTHVFADIKDPVTWQRDIREDRVLVDRED